MAEFCGANKTPNKKWHKAIVLKSCDFADLNSARDGAKKKQMDYEVKKKCFTKYILISRGFIGIFITDKNFLICSKVWEMLSFLYRLMGHISLTCRFLCVCL